MNTQPKLLTFLSILAVLFFLFALYLVFFYAPLEAVMNYVQKIFYFHIASAWVGMLGFIASSVAGIVYLKTKDIKWDVVEVAAIEISLVFFFMAISSGSIWAKPSWGTWWTWDARLTTAAILEMIYAANLILREGIQDPHKQAKFGAVYTILGGISVPLTFISIHLWQTIHPAIFGTQGSETSAGFNMTPAMMQTMFVGLIAFSILFITILWHRIRIAQLAVNVNLIKQELSK